MKKVFVLWICVLLFTCFFGCDMSKPNRASSEGVESSSDEHSNVSIRQDMADAVPFLRMHDGKAYGCQWNIQARTVDIGADALFRYTTTEESYAFPVALWDGADAFTFNNEEDIESISDEILPAFRPYAYEQQPEMELVLFGQNVNVYAQNMVDYSEGLIFELNDAHGISTVDFAGDAVPAQIWKQLFQQNGELVLSFAHYEKGCLTAVFFSLQSHKVFTVFYDSKESKWRMEESEYAESIVPPQPYRSVLVQDKIFFVTNLDISSLDLVTFEYTAMHAHSAHLTQQMREFITDNNYGYPIPYDGTNGVLLVMLPISGGEYIENVTFAFKEESYLGALHYRDGSIFTYDAKGNRTINAEDLPCDYFQFSNNCTF